MKKKIFLIILSFNAIITFHTDIYGQQCDSPSTCTQVTFTPNPASQIPIAEFDLDCNNNSIETVLGIPGATDIEYRWYSDNMNAPVEGTLDTPPPGTYTLEITYMLPGVAEPVCCSQEIIVNDWGLDVEMEIRRQGETTPITEVCLGENVVLVSLTNTFPAPYIFTLPDGTTTTSNDAGTVYTTSDSGVNSFSLQVQDSNGCIGFASASIIVNAPPTLAPTTDPNPSCAGEAITVNAGLVPGSQGPYTFLWNTGETDSQLFPTPSQNTNYSVTVTDANDCMSEDSINVQVNPIPDATISTNNQSICLGQSTTLTAPAGMDSYSWITTGETSQSISVTPNNTTDYILEVIKGGCTNTDTITITVIPPTNIEIMGDDEVCAGGSTTLTAPQADTYMWSNGEMTQSITVSPTMDENYSVTITNSGCTSTGSVLVSTKPAPTATIMGNTQICEGESTSLTAGGGDAYMWSTGEMTQSITVNPASSQSYSVTVTSGNDCTDTEMQTVNVTSVNLTISGNTMLCEGESTTLTASAGGTYEWSTGEMTQSITVNPTETMTYEVTKTVNNCSLTEQVTVNINPAYDVSISETICPGDSYTVGNSTYTATGDYTDVLTASNGCDSTVNLSLTVQPIPSYEYLQDSLFGKICSPQAITVDIQDELYEFTWQSPNSDNVIPGDGCTALNIQEDPTIFSLEVSTGNCTETHTYSINLTAVASDAKVFRFANTDVLFCNRNDFESYQWGKESKTTLCPEPDTDGIGIFQDYVVPDGINDEYYYWVIVEQDGCTNKIYLENNSPFGKLVVDPNTEYGNLALQINPNPNNGAFELTITGDEVRALDVHVYDALGRMIHHQDAFKEYDIQTYYVAVPNLTQGIYFVRITGNDGILLTEKIIVK